MVESELVKLLKAADEGAFAELVNNHQHLVFNTAMGLLQSAEEAEDLSQEVFIQIFESIASFKGESKLTTWIYKITVTKSLDRIKYLRRKKRGGWLSNIFNNDASIFEVPDFNHPGVKLANKENAALLFKAIATLPDNQRIAFTLSKVEGLSQQEIAAVLDCSESSVEGLLHRAKQNLRKVLNDYYYHK